MRKRFLDQMIVCISLAIFAVAWAYPDQVRYRIACLGVSAAIAVVFLFLAWTKKETGQRAGTGSDTEGSKRAAITDILPLWNMGERETEGEREWLEFLQDMFLPIDHQVFLF